MHNHCIVYISNSYESWNEDELSIILLQSRHHNAQAGITGILLYLNKQIIQVLEGNKQELAKLYERIERDKRHTQVTKIIDCLIKQRLFPSWSMAYQTLQASQLEEFIVIVNTSEKKANSTAQGKFILALIDMFYDTYRKSG